MLFALVSCSCSRLHFQPSSACSQERKDMKSWRRAQRKLIHKMKWCGLTSAAIALYSLSSLATSILTQLLVWWPMVVEYLEPPSTRILRGYKILYVPSADRIRFNRIDMWKICRKNLVATQWYIQFNTAWVVLAFPYPLQQPATLALLLQESQSNDHYDHLNDLEPL